MSGLVDLAGLPFAVSAPYGSVAHSFRPQEFSALKKGFE
jgi:hypothetical protein